jgi:hypothetical protein
MNTEHTPGPWELHSEGWGGQLIYGNDERANGRRLIAEVSLRYDGSRANAQLLVTAPALLEALHSLVHSLEETDLLHDDQRKAFTAAIQAISQATKGVT